MMDHLKLIIHLADIKVPVKVKTEPGLAEDAGEGNAGGSPGLPILRRS